MKGLLLLRHASAGNSPAGVSDHERELAPEGVRDAAQLGEYLTELPTPTSLVLCASAKRCFDSLQLLRRDLPENVEVRIERELYLAGADHLLQTIVELDEQHAGALLVAHSPGLAELAIRLATRGDAEARARMGRGFPPASLARFELDVERWSETRPSIARLVDFVRPADLE